MANDKKFKNVKITSEQQLFFFYFAFPWSLAIRRCLPESSLIAAHTRTRIPVDRDTHKNTQFSECTSGYSCIYCCKLQTPALQTSFETRPCLFREALISMPHLPRVGNFFFSCFTLTEHGCNRNQPNGSFIAL